MSIPMQSLLSKHGIDFEVLEHQHAATALSTAAAAHIPSAQLAKAVVLGNSLEQKIMAVIPANKQLLLSAVNNFTYSDYHLLQEDEFSDVFNDCEAGAVPSVGREYGMEMIIDMDLMDGSDIYLETGDHRHLLKVSLQDYQGLVMSSRHATISNTAMFSYYVVWISIL